MLNLFRRHSRECLEGLNRRKLPKGQTIRTFRGCGCPVWFSGSHAGTWYPRQSLGVNDWAQGEFLLTEKMVGPKEQPAEERRTIASAFDAWHVSCSLADGVAPNTLAEHKLEERRLLEGGRTRLVYLDELDLEYINQVRATWKCARSTYRLRTVILSAFFNFCKRQDWIQKNPFQSGVHGGVKLPALGEVSKDDTMPLDTDGTETNYRKVLDALAALPNEKGSHRTEHGRRVAVAKLMYETGMRISDAIMFRPGICEPVEEDGVAIYEFLAIKTAKYGRRCTTFLPLELLAEIQALGDLSPGYPFFDGVSPRRSHETMMWHAFVAASDLSGVPDVHAHRFRNSFAVNRLNNGARIEDVSAMLGHSDIKTTQKHYAPWVQSRKDALRASYLRTRTVPENVIKMPKHKQSA